MYCRADSGRSAINLAACSASRGVCGGSASGLPCIAVHALCMAAASRARAFALLAIEASGSRSPAWHIRSSRCCRTHALFTTRLRASMVSSMTWGGTGRPACLQSRKRRKHTAASGLTDCPPEPVFHGNHPRTSREWRATRLRQSETALQRSAGPGRPLRAPPHVHRNRHLLRIQGGQ